MRAFLVRSRDVVAMLSSITDEVLRQQRLNEVNLRKAKRQLRERFDRPERNEELAELKSGSKAISMNLLNEVMDVSVNISVAFYLIYKFWSNVTGTNELDAKGETDVVRENNGETQLVSEMLTIITEDSAGSLLARGMKRLALKTGENQYLKKVTGAFRAFEQDLRDGIQDVELALSAYRLRVDAENALYDALRQPRAAEMVGEVTIERDEDTKKIKVEDLPSYDSIVAKDRRRKQESRLSLIPPRLSDQPQEDIRVPSPRPFNAQSAFGTATL
jgi:hypothetical protein